MEKSKHIPAVAYLQSIAKMLNTILLYTSFTTLRFVQWLFVVTVVICSVVCSSSALSGIPLTGDELVIGLSANMIMMIGGMQIAATSIADARHAELKKAIEALKQPDVPDQQLPPS